MRVLAWCLLPNHFYLVAWPREDGDLSRWMQWLLTSHERRYHRPTNRAGTIGRAASRPFRSSRTSTCSPCCDTWRGIPCGPSRSRYERRSGGRGSSERRPSISRFPSCIPPGAARAGVDRMSQPAAIGGGADGPTRVHCARAPARDRRWARTTATRLGLESSLRPRGRPRNSEK
jgi:putative transposase